MQQPPPTNNDDPMSLDTGNDKLPKVQSKSKLLPEANSHVNLAPTHEKYTYLAKLDFTKFPSAGMSKAPTASIPSCLTKWIMHTRILSPSFELLPYDEGNDGTKGHPITHEDQLPTNNSHAYALYYHNHCITPAKFLTGMVRFSMSLPWGKSRSRYYPILAGSIPREFIWPRQTSSSIP